MMWRSNWNELSALIRSDESTCMQINPLTRLFSLSEAQNYPAGHGSNIDHHFYWTANVSLGFWGPVS